MKFATIFSSILIVIWVILTMLVMWTESINGDMYVKISISMGVVLLATLLITLAFREYGSEQKLKEHNYLD